MSRASPKRAYPGRSRACQGAEEKCSTGDRVKSIRGRTKAERYYLVGRITISAGSERAWRDLAAGFSMTDVALQPAGVQSSSEHLYARRNQTNRQCARIELRGDLAGSVERSETRPWRAAPATDSGRMPALSTAAPVCVTRRRAETPSGPPCQHRRRSGRPGPGTPRASVHKGAPHGRRWRGFGATRRSPGGPAGRSLAPTIMKQRE
jgi:hypothetical protein